MTAGFLPVKVNVPLDQYKRLNAEAERNGVTVADLLLRSFVSAAPEPARTRSGYTTKAGEEIAAGRRFGMTWGEIATDLNISTFTAQAWLRKYQAEVREQNARDRAERRAG